MMQIPTIMPMVQPARPAFAVPLMRPAPRLKRAKITPSEPKKQGPHVEHEQKGADRHDHRSGRKGLRTRPARRLYGRLLLVMLIRSGTLALRHAVRMGGLIGISGLIGVWIVIFWCHKMSFLLQKSAVSHAVCQKSYSKDFIM